MRSTHKRPVIGAQTQQQSSLLEPLQDAGSVIGDVLFSPMGALLAVAIAILVFTSRGNKSGDLTSARWATGRDRNRALKMARQQLASPKVKDQCLWIGRSPHESGFMTPPGIVLPYANQSVSVVGGPGYGKTFSAINPMVASAIEQGMPVVLYEYKADDRGRGGQMEFLAALAARHGYKVRVFAPGRDYTCTFNFLDFLDGPDDDTTAKVLAEVFQKNLKSDSGKSDAFFGEAGQQLLQGLFQFAKSTRYPDLAMAFAVARLPNLPERLVYADQSGGSLPMAVRVAFSQFMSTAGAEKTSSGIVATAGSVLNPFMSSRILASIVGNTNVSLRLGGKEMLVFQGDIERSDVISPILAAAINLALDRNFAVQRDVPLVFSADEVPTIFLPQLPTLPNVHRSKGLIAILGYQSNPQLVERYGRERAEILRSAIGTRIWFNPGNQDTAKEMSNYLGEYEVTIEQKSTSRTRGDDRGKTVSKSEQTRTRSLMTADEFLRMDVGECVLLNPGYKDENAANLPQHLRVKIPNEFVALVSECEELWGEQVLPTLREREQARRGGEFDLDTVLGDRIAEAERLLPMPPDENDDSSNGSKNSHSTSPAASGASEDGGWKGGAVFTDL